MPILIGRVAVAEVRNTVQAGVKLSRSKTGPADPAGPVSKSATPSPVLGSSAERGAPLFTGMVVTTANVASMARDHQGGLDFAQPRAGPRAGPWRIRCCLVMIDRMAPISPS